MKSPIHVQTAKGTIPEVQVQLLCFYGREQWCSLQTHVGPTQHGQIFVYLL